MTPPGARLARALGFALAAGAGAAGAASGPIAFHPFLTGLAAPVELTHAGDGSGRLFVVEQAGTIRVVKGPAVLTQPYLTVPVQGGGEQGLLGLAFHPAFRTNGRFYVFHTAAPAAGGSGSDLVIAEYRDNAGFDFAFPGTRREILRIPHPGATNHNGGKLAFGRDGYLYIAVGDGGGGGDPQNHAQNLGSLLGKILRIDVDSGSPYALPASNPFTGTVGARPEVFAYGLRNPWRFSFDRATGDLFIADVGQDRREEVNLIPNGSSGGQNFGWRVFEGSLCYNPSSACALPGHVGPILQYNHDATGGYSITGGYRYRGANFPELRGHYVYSDFVSGRVWGAAPDTGATWVATVSGSLPNLSAFGEDEAGELYALDLANGAVLRAGPPDVDGDGMSDAFETAHFGGPTAGHPDGDADGDGLPDLYEYREGRDPGVADNDVFTDPRLFAGQQYRDIFARAGDALGVEYWAAQVAAGARSRGQVIEFFTSSSEFQEAIAPVARLYFAYFLRIPDYSGLTYWIAARRGGITVEDISAYFAASPEFHARYGALDNGAFVDLAYRNVLGREPDPGGRAFWVAELDSGRRTRGMVMAGFSESGEYVGLTRHEVFVTLAYVSMLRRAPDPGGFSFWVGRLDGGGSGLAMIDGFLATSEYRARFLP